MQDSDALWQQLFRCDRRTQLAPERAEMLLFIRENFEYINVWLLTLSSLNDDDGVDSDELMMQCTDLFV